MVDALHKEIGALTAGLEAINRELQEAREGRRRTYEKLEGWERRLDRLEYRQENMEKMLGVMSPTVNEFATMKMQAAGAGRFGLFLWKLGGWILAAAAGAATAWGWLASHFTWK